MKKSEEERLKLEARETKVIPVKVTLNADQLNSVEVGAGYGSDSGARLRTQYRRAIVNQRGHSFDANLELSEIRQAIDGRYNIPYKHPLNDYISLVGGYEREERDDIGQGVNLLTESAVAGADRVIKNPMGNWQHTYGVRYRLDRLTQKGSANVDDLPDAFIANNDPEQESLLLGYEDPPSEINLDDGVYYNAYIYGNNIKMPKPLLDDQVEYNDGTEATEQQMAKDVVTFLAWAAEPHLEARHKIGFKAIIYLIIISILAYLSMKRLWSRIEPEV